MYIGRIPNGVALFHSYQSIVLGSVRLLGVFVLCMCACDELNASEFHGTFLAHSVNTKYPSRHFKPISKLDHLDGVKRRGAWSLFSTPR